MHFDWFDFAHHKYAQHKQKGRACRQAGFTPVLVLVGILVIMAIAGGAYYFGKSQAPKPQTQNQVVSQTPQPTSVSSSIPATSPVPTGIDETANWKTYSNSTYGFSFKYPDNISVSEVHSKYINLTGGLLMPILISENPEGLPRREFFAKYQNSTVEELSPYLNIKEVQVGNKSALRIVQSTDFFQQSLPYTSYLVASGNNIIRMVTSEYSGKSSNNQTTVVPNISSSTVKLYQQILSTFRFTN